MEKLSSFRESLGAPVSKEEEDWKAHKLVFDKELEVVVAS